MSENNYGIRARLVDTGKEYMLLTYFSTEIRARAEIETLDATWRGIYVFTVVSPYTPPAVTHEDDLTTAAGSPCMGGDDDLLGIPPGC